MTVHRRTTVIAVFGGDNMFTPATARRLVHVRAIVGESLRRSYRRQRDVRLYHRGVNPALVVKLLPAHKGSCIHFRAQRHYAGHWHTTAVSHCVRTDKQGLALGVFRGDHVVGKLYRVRAEWRGSRAVEARDGAWLRLRFSD
ncbi:MAG: hypothetical protein JO222_12780 [Frankiales bacterium]|nr:hypothetical protein [Frankiales bacterium]